MLSIRDNAPAILTLAIGAAFASMPDVALAYTQGYAPTVNYGYQETGSTGGNPLIFGVAAFKICQIKTFLFAGVYILGAIAFVIFAIRALFTKFEIKQFLPILGALFVVASADLFIYWMSEDAFFCPTAMSQFGG